MSAVLQNPPVVPRQESPGLWQLAWRRLRQDRVGMVSLVVVIFFLLMMVGAFTGLIASDWAKEKGVSYANPSFLAGAENLEARAMAAKGEAGKAAPVDLSDVDPLAPRYAEWNAAAAKYATVEAPKARTLPFGGDRLGRDVLAKAVKAAQISILVGVLAAVLATLIGTALGALAGFFGGRVGDLLEWVYNVFTSIPGILLIFAFAAVAGRGVQSVVLILGLTGWTGIYRLVRA